MSLCELSLLMLQSSLPQHTLILSVSLTLIAVMELVYPSLGLDLMELSEMDQTILSLMRLTTALYVSIASMSVVITMLDILVQ